MKIVTNEKMCIGCLACVVTCIDHHYEADAAFPAALRRHHRVTKPSGLTQYVTDSCRHCENARCIEACPQHAIVRDEQGWVQVDENRCVGCMICAVACPFDSPVLRGDGKMVKCDGCAGETHCVTICPCGALTVVE